MTLAEAVGDTDVIHAVHALLIDHPLPLSDGRENAPDPVAALRETYSAQEQAALVIAAGLDPREDD